MSQSVNDILLEETIRRHIELQHYSNAEVRRAIAILNRYDPELLAALDQALAGDPQSIRAIDAALQQVMLQNAAAYSAVGKALEVTLSNFAAHESEAQQKLLQHALPDVIDVKLASDVARLGMSQPIRGRLLSEWLSGMQLARAQKIREVVRMGVVNGQTTPAIVQTIRGTKAANYTDGLLSAPRRDVETLVRTSIAHIASVARDETAKLNSDVVESISWLATLDSRTTILCMTHDGERYSIPDHTPLGPLKLPWLGGPGNAHFNCRSVSVYVTKSWQAYGLNAPPEGTRASMDGYVPESMTYAEWLKKQSAGRIEQILGPTRAKLYRDGNLDLSRFVNDKGRLLTLDQLKSRDAAAFTRAGV